MEETKPREWSDKWDDKVDLPCAIALKTDKEEMVIPLYQSGKLV